MVRLDKLDPERTQIDGLSHVLLTFRFVDAHQVVFVQFMLNQPHCQLCRIERHIQLSQHIRQRTDMILMSVGK